MDGGEGCQPEAVAPQSYVQEWMSTGKRACPNPGWNMLLPWRLSGPLDRAALLDGLDEVVRRHEVLQTTFADSEGRPVQVIHPHRPLDLELIDLRSLPEPGRVAELHRLARARHGLALDHERGPLLAGVVVRATDGDTFLLLTVDHAVCDGWSIGVLLAELTAFYNGVVGGRGVRLWELPLQFRDYAAGQRRLAAEGGYDEQLAWWERRLAPEPAPLGLAYGAPPARPPDRPSDGPPDGPPGGSPGASSGGPSEVDGYRSAQHPLVVPADVAARLRALGQRSRTTLFATLLAGLSAALARRDGSGDVAVTTLVAGRKAEHQRLIGMFANPLVLRTSVAGAGTFGGLLDRVRRGVLEAYGRQDVPFPLVADRAGVRAAQVWLNVALRPALARFRGIAVDTQALPRDYPIDVPAAGWRGETLICNLADTGDEIAGLIDYNTAQVGAEAVRELADDLLAQLRDAAGDPARPLPAIGDRPPLY